MAKMKERRARHRTFVNGTDNRSAIPLDINKSGSRIVRRRGMASDNPTKRK